MDFPSCPPNVLKANAWTTSKGKCALLFLFKPHPRGIFVASNGSLWSVFLTAAPPHCGRELRAPLNKQFCDVCMYADLKLTRRGLQLGVSEHLVSSYAGENFAGETQ